MTRAMQRRAHGRKRLNLNNVESRAAEADAAQPNAQIAESIPSSTPLPASRPPTSTTALAVVASLVGAVILLGIAFWRYRIYKRRNARAVPSLAGRVAEYHSEKHIDLANASNATIYTEKPQKAALSPRSFDSDAGWVPNTKAYPVANVSIPEPTAAPKSKAKSPGVPFSVKTPSETPLDLPRSHPPSYFLANSPAENDGQPPRLIPNRPSPGITTNSPPESFASLSEQPPMPAFTPRSESFTIHDPSESPSGKSGSSQKLPRLMSVTTIFTPTLDDELSIKVGDTVRMLQEYRDGWCLVQHVGHINATRGAVPRFCLQERRGVVPTSPSRKFGSLKSSTSGWY